jgi:hypothetical protein
VTVLLANDNNPRWAAINLQIVVSTHVRKLTFEEKVFTPTLAAFGVMPA